MFFNVLFWVSFGSHFWGVLGAQMEAKSIKKRVSKVSQNYDENMIIFWSILGSLWAPIGAQHRSKIDHFFVIILRDFWEPLFDALGLHWSSQNTSKRRPKRDPKQNIQNHRFCCYLLHLGYIRGSWKSSFWELFWYPFPSTLSEPLFDRFWTILGTLLDPFGHPKSISKKTQKKTPKNI